MMSLINKVYKRGKSFNGKELSYHSYIAATTLSACLEVLQNDRSKRNHENLKSVHHRSRSRERAFLWQCDLHMCLYSVV